MQNSPCTEPQIFTYTIFLVKDVVLGYLKSFWIQKFHVEITCCAINYRLHVIVDIFFPCKVIIISVASKHVILGNGRWLKIMTIISTQTVFNQGLRRFMQSIRGEKEKTEKEEQGNNTYCKISFWVK